ncbi:hypothetical protein HK104_006755 [Borealophlyctis nickersoniae]|nr:hypothetical protein HK104_006755 [Borealophlyctis nickersoniae]
MSMNTTANTAQETQIEDDDKRKDEHRSFYAPTPPSSAAGPSSKPILPRLSHRPPISISGSATPPFLSFPSAYFSAPLPDTLPVFVSDSASGSSVALSAASSSAPLVHSDRIPQSLQYPELEDPSFNPYEPNEIIEVESDDDVSSADGEGIPLPPSSPPTPPPNWSPDLLTASRMASVSAGLDKEAFVNAVGVGGKSLLIDNGLTKDGMRRGWTQRWKFVKGNMKLVVEYVVRETRRSKRSFVIGLLTVFMTVAFLSFIQNTLSRASVLFVRLSEDTAGEWDLLLTPSPSNTSQSLFLNYTSINASLADSASAAGAAPRWIAPVTIGFNNLNVSAYALVMDHQYEQKIGLGRRWPYRDLRKLEVSLSASVMRSHKIMPNAGQRVNITLSLAQFMSAFTSGISNVGDSSAGSGSGSSDSVAGPPSPSSSSSSTSSSSSSSPSTADTSTNSGGTNTSNPLLSILPAGGVTVPAAWVNALPAAQKNQVLAAGNRDANGNLIITPATMWSQLVSGAIAISQEFSVVDAIESPYGKYPPAIGNVAVLGFEATQTLLRGTLDQMINTNPILQFALAGAAGSNGTGAGIASGVESASVGLRSLQLRDYVMSVIVLKTNRIETYLKSQKSRNADMISFSNDVAMRVGIGAPIDYTAVISTALDATVFMQIYLQEVFFTVVVILSVLAVILIYSLLLADVEEKTFEYGMLRTLGLKQKTLINLLTFQSLYFSFPGISLGLLISFIAYIPIAYFISTFTATPLLPTFTLSALLLSILLGLCLPLLGTIVPIRRALSKTLRDALDVFRTSVNDTDVRVAKLEEIGLSVTETVVACVLVGVGFLVYYVVPLSFMLQDLSIFFRIMTVILLGMVFGEILLGQTIQHLVELAAVRLIIHGRDRPLAHIVSKNLASHLRRNNKTALMFTLSLAYIIFAATMFTLQAGSVRQAVEWKYGADVIVTGPRWSKPVPEAKLRAYFESQKGGNGAGAIVEGYTFVTYDLSTMKSLNWINLSPITYVNNPNVKIYGLESTFLDATLLRYYQPSVIDHSVAIPSSTASGIHTPDVVTALNTTLDPRLYTTVPKSLWNSLPSFAGVTPEWNDGAFPLPLSSYYNTSIPILIPSAFTDGAQMTINSLLTLTLNWWPPGGPWSQSRVYACKPIALLDKLPGFISVNPMTVNNAPVFVGMGHFRALMQDVQRGTGVNVTQQVPMGTVLVKVRKGASRAEVDALAADLTTVIGDGDITVSTLIEHVQSTEAAAEYIMYLFYIVALVGVIFSFFVLWLSFTANIRENSWEFGVLRALGFPVSAVLRVYIYEAICIMLACIIIGTTIGLITSYALTLQSNLFTNLPFSFYFPIGLYLIVTLLSVVVSVAGSYLPAQVYAKEKIALVLKGK